MDGSDPMVDKATLQRALRLRDLMNGSLRNMTPQERDRRMQVFLAAARGPALNAKLLCDMTALLLRARQIQQQMSKAMPANPIYEVIEIMAKALTQAGIEYAITGSVASSLHGEPASTQGVDMIVRMTESQARSLARTLPPRFYRNEESLVEAARVGGLVNVVDMDTVFKVDLSVVPMTPFHRAVFARKRSVEFEPGRMPLEVVTPEDIILMKLVWRKDTRSQKQWHNALSVARVRGARMDWKYLFDNARVLGVEEDLVKLRDEAGI